MLLIYQNHEKTNESLFSSSQIEFSLTTQRILTKIYESAIESLQLELLKIGMVTIDVLRIKDYGDQIVGHFLEKKEYWETIKQIDAFIPALKVVIRSLGRKYKDSTLLLKDQGFIVSLDKAFY